MFVRVTKLKGTNKIAFKLIFTLVNGRFVCLSDLN